MSKQSSNSIARAMALASPLSTDASIMDWYFLSAGCLISIQEGRGSPNSSATSEVVIIVPNYLFKIISSPILSNKIKQLVSEMIALCIE